MSREVESDNSSAGIQSPEPITEGSISSEVISELKDVSSAVCSKCGSSKQNRDKGIKPSEQTLFICNCRSKPEEMPREGESDNSSAGIQSPEPITEGSLSSEVVSDLKDVSSSLPLESICSKCGGAKPLGPTRFICNCRSKPEEIPREMASDNSSAGIQSPEPITEGSISFEVISELKDVSSAMPGESICLKCGGSKQREDGVIKPLEPIRLICTCRSKPEEIPREGESEDSSAGIQSPEPITEGSLTPEPVSELKDISDALSSESICSKCGGSKGRDRATKPLPPRRFICNCRPKTDETRQEEDIPLQECPETDAAVKEIAQIQESRAGDISPLESTDPSQGDPPAREPPAQQEPTTGCVDEIYDMIMDDVLLECNWYQFACYLTTFIILLISIGIAVNFLSEHYSNTTNGTNSSSTNFTVDED